MALFQEKLPRLRDSAVFDTKGKPCCIIGHLIDRAGLRNRLHPFKGKSFDGTPGVRHWDGAQTLKILVGNLSESEELLLEQIQITNDSHRGRTRINKLKPLLQKLSIYLRGTNV
jgi:hypothetical protein